MVHDNWRYLLQVSRAFVSTSFNPWQSWVIRLGRAMKLLLLWILPCNVVQWPACLWWMWLNGQPWHFLSDLYFSLPSYSLHRDRLAKLDFNLILNLALFFPCQVLNLGPNEASVFSFAVQGGLTLEICLARWWSCLVEGQAEILVDFHSVFTTQEMVCSLCILLNTFVLFGVFNVRGKIMSHSN